MSFFVDVCFSWIRSYKKERMAKAFKIFNSRMKTRKQNQEEKQNKWLKGSAEHAHFDILTICIWCLTRNADIWMLFGLVFSHLQRPWQRISREKPWANKSFSGTRCCSSPWPSKMNAWQVRETTDWGVFGSDLGPRFLGAVDVFTDSANGQPLNFWGLLINRKNKV